MNRSFAPALVLAVVLSCSQWTTALHAGDPNKWDQPTWKVPDKQFDEITSIDAASKTITIRHAGGNVKVEHTLKVDAFSDIKVDDKKATLADLKVGMRVRFSLGMDGETLGRLETVPLPTPPPTPVPTATPSFPGSNRPG